MKSTPLDTAVFGLYVAVDDRGSNIDGVSIGARKSIQDLVEKYNSTGLSIIIVHCFLLQTIDSPDTSDYHCRPWNYQDFLARLHSFQNASDWFAKPESVSAPQCALQGWWNCGRDKLKCTSCGVQIEHKSGESSFTYLRYSNLSTEDFEGKQLLASLSECHEESCGWRTLSCDVSFLDLQNTAPLSLNRQLVSGLFESLNNVNNYGPSLSVLLQFLVSSSDMDWFKAFPASYDSGSCLIDIPSKESVTRLMSVVSSMQSSMTSTTTKRDRLEGGGTLLELLLLHSAQLTSSGDSSLSLSLVGLLLLTVYGWSVKAEKRDDNSSGGGKLCLSCSVCNRSIPLPSSSVSSGSSSVVKSFNVVNQHKPYCSFVRPQSTCSPSLLGYQLLLHALTQIREYPVKRAAATAIVDAAKSCSEDGSEEGSKASVEQSYKRIRTVLDNAL